MARPTRFTAARKQELLEHVANGYTMSQAAELVGVGRQVVKRAKKADERFAEAYEEAFEAGTDRWRENVRLLGFDAEVPARDRLLASFFELKRRDPSYRDNYRVELGGVGGGPVPMEVNGGRATSLADVLALAQELGIGLGAGIAAGARAGLSDGDARPALPGAEDVR